MIEDEEITLRVKINGNDFPALVEFLQSEPNQMRRTRKLCQLATQALHGAEMVKPVSALNTHQTSVPLPVKTELVKTLGSNKTASSSFGDIDLSMVGGVETF
ncbi:hypothetical protein AAKU64_004070 [Undibacterium sp. GrIS 1.8]|uniref:hypothetical protein n=1 Tax=unclassified Undibacterium TaxID=2630295 RepID=UPI0033965312